jgi:hemoglobin
MSAAYGGTIWAGGNQIMVEITQSLYAALGAEVGIRTVVNDFYDRVLSDPLLAPYFSSIDLPDLRRHQVAFLSAATGGPKQYSGRSLADAHADLRVSGEAFDHVVRHLVQSLHACGVDPDTVDQVVAALAPLRSDIVCTA